MKKAILEGLPQPDLLRGTFQSTISTMGQPGSVYPTQLDVQVQTYGPDVDLALVKIEDSVEEDFWVPSLPTVVGWSGLGGGEWWG